MSDSYMRCPVCRTYTNVGQIFVEGLHPDEHYLGIAEANCRYQPHTPELMQQAEACEKRHQEQSATLFGDKDKIVVTRQQILDWIKSNPETEP